LEHYERDGRIILKWILNGAISRCERILFLNRELERKMHEELFNFIRNNSYVIVVYMPTGLGYKKLVVKNYIF